MQEGDYTFQLTVTDSAGQQETAQVTVIVQPGTRRSKKELLIITTWLFWIVSALKSFEEYFVNKLLKALIKYIYYNYH